MQRGKWIKDLAPDTAVEDAAWRVLTIRCDTVRQALEEASDKSDDPDAVHQLRVATRRAGAALWLFRESLSAKLRKKLKRLLREIRRTAGVIRDGDVLLGRLRWYAKDLDRSDRPAIDFLVGYTVAQRLPGDVALALLAKKAPGKFDKLSSKAIGSIKPAQPDQKLADLARESLASQLTRLDRALAKDSHELADLHEIRIIGKRLRYTMEIVADCYPKEFRTESYSLIAEMQEILGEIHDHDVSVQLYSELSERSPQLLRKRSRRYRPTLERLIQRHQEAIFANLPQFDEWRKQWRSHAGELGRMVEVREESAPLPVDDTADAPTTDAAPVTDDGTASE